jgi:hypothetical protein
MRSVEILWNVIDTSGRGAQETLATETTRLFICAVVRILTAS